MRTLNTLQRILLAVIVCLLITVGFGVSADTGTAHAGDEQWVAVKPVRHAFGEWYSAVTNGVESIVLGPFPSKRKAKRAAIIATFLNGGFAGHFDDGCSNLDGEELLDCLGIEL